MPGMWVVLIKSKPHGEALGKPYYGCRRIGPVAFSNIIMSYSADLKSFKRMLISGALMGSFLVFTSVAAHASTYNFTTLDVPNATFTYATDINNNGQVVGYFFNAANAEENHGFVYNGSTYKTIDPPNSIPRTLPYGINDSGEVSGIYVDRIPNVQKGFVYNGSTYTTIVGPEPNSTLVSGINDDGQLVGTFETQNPHSTHGLVYNGSTYTILDVPNANFTNAYGINDSGQVVGFFNDGDGYHGFIATPSAVPLPASAWLFILAIAGWVGLQGVNSGGKRRLNGLIGS
jgi:probable HAF family extracellular repeat protein